MLTNDHKRENNWVFSINKNMTNLAIAVTTFDIDFLVMYDVFTSGLGLIMAYYRDGLTFRPETTPLIYIALHTEPYCSSHKLDHVGGPFCDSHAKNRIQIGHFSYFFGRFSEKFRRKSSTTSPPFLRTRVSTPRILSHILINTFSSFFQDRPKKYEKWPIWIQFFAYDSENGPPTSSKFCFFVFYNLTPCAAL